MMNKEFTKSDLMDGMIIKIRRGDFGLVLRNRILYGDGWGDFDHIREDLTNKHNNNFDIIKVYNIEIKNVFGMKHILNNVDIHHNLVWEREEIKYMTAEEMRQKLEELTDEKIKIARKRDKGRWILLNECSNAGVYCSVCRKKVYKEDYANQKIKSKFCPNCGSRMES